MVNTYAPLNTFIFDTGDDHPAWDYLHANPRAIPTIDELEIALAEHKALEAR